MRLDGLDHPKTNELASRLGVTKPTAIGHLELLWAFVGKLAPQGNVGKYPDGAIARAAEWQGDPTAFVDALLLARLVDECGTHRLVVHDWAEHCPSWVRAKVKKTRLDLITGPTPPTLMPTRMATIVGTEVDFSGDFLRARVPSEAKRREAYPRNPTLMPTIDANRVEPPPPAPTRAAEWDYAGKVPLTDRPGDADLVAAFAVIRETYPRKAGRAHNWILGERAWLGQIDAGFNIGELHEGVTRYRAFVDGGGVSSDSYVLGVDQFFGAVDRPWQQLWQLPTQLRGGSGRKSVGDKLAALDEDLQK